MYDPMETGKRIRELRKKNNLTQEAICAETGINLKTYQAVEQGTRGARIDTLCILQKFYGVSLDYLVNGDDPELQAESEINGLLSTLNNEKKEQMIDLVKRMVLMLK